MKNILEAPYLKEFCLIADNMYRLGYDERNGGNISYRLLEEDVKDYLDLNAVIRTIPFAGVHPTSFDASALVGQIFLVTGTGKYFKNILRDPANNLGIVRIAKDGKNAELLWGFEDGGRFTSEFPAHMMSHAARQSVDPTNRVVMHCHPTNILAMTFVHDLDEAKFTHTLWEMMTECLVVFPDGVGVLPWMLCGTDTIGYATAAKLKEFRMCVWSMHGLYGVGKDLDEAFGLIETAEKAAQIYNLIGSRKVKQTITEDQFMEIVELFSLKPRYDFFQEEKYRKLASN